MKTSLSTGRPAVGVGSWGVKFSFESVSLPDDPEDSDLIQEFNGNILHTPDDSDEAGVEQVVGKINGARVKLGEAFERRAPIYDIFDAHSDWLSQYYGAFFDEHELKGDLELGMLGDFLAINSIEIDPKYRGLDVGLVALRRTVLTFGGGCAIVAIKPFPLQFSGKVTPENEAEFLKAQNKLRKYWSRLGFQHYGESEFYYFDPTCRLRRIQKAGKGPSCLGAAPSPAKGDE